MKVFLNGIFKHNMDYSTLPASHGTDWPQSLWNCGMEHSIQTHTIATTEFIKCTWLQGGGDLWPKHVLIPPVQTGLHWYFNSQPWENLGNYYFNTKLSEKCSQHQSMQWSLYRNTVHILTYVIPTKFSVYCSVLWGNHYSYNVNLW